MCAEADVRDALLLIVRLVYDCTYIRSLIYGKVMQLKQVTAMCWIISPVNAIVALLCIEHKSQFSWLADLFLSFRRRDVHAAKHHNEDRRHSLSSAPPPTTHPAQLQSGPFLDQHQAISTRAIQCILSASTILIDGRYIDDIYQMLTVDLRALNDGDIDALLPARGDQTKTR